MRCRDGFAKRTIGWAIVMLLLAVGLGTGPHAAAAEPFDELDTAAHLVPADAAFFWSAMRGREQFDAVAGSNAWAKLKTMPFVQMGIGLYNLQALDQESVPGQINAALRDPEQRKLIDLAAEMASDEVFLYGGESMVGGVALLQQINSATRYGPMVLQLGGPAESLDENELQAMLMLAVLAENVDLIRVPEMILGMKIKSTEVALAQRDRLEAILREAIEQQSEVKAEVGRTDVAGTEYLTLTLPLRELPWDELPLEELDRYETSPGDAKKVIDAIKALEVVVALGVRGEYVLLSVGPSTDVLARLGEGPSLLTRPEMKPLGQFADRRVASLSYLSPAMAKAAADTQQQIDDALEAVEQLLPLAELDPAQEKELRRDARAFAEGLKQFIPKPGPVAAISFLTDRGVEAYQYDWTVRTDLDGSKPLGLLGHLGGSPVLAVVGREKGSSAQYAFLSKWGRRAFEYVETLALPKMPEDERAELRQFLDVAGPLLDRADTATRELLLPALADGQLALVVDRRLESERFLEALPPTDKPMPMLEPGLVVGVSDADLLCRAMGEYLAVARGMLDGMRQIEDADIPEDVRIPDPQIETTAGVRLYSYALPAEWGVDKQIVPNAGLGDGVAAMSLSHDHTLRLLRQQPLAAGGVLTDAARPRATAAVFDMAGFIEAVKPWVGLAFDQASADEPAGGEIAAIREQVDTVLDVLQALRTFTSESYFEGGALVTHGLMEIEDIAP